MATIVSDFIVCMTVYFYTIIEITFAFLQNTRLSFLSFFRAIGTVTYWAWIDHPAFSLVVTILISPFLIEQNLRFRNEIHDVMEMSWLQWFHVSFSLIHAQQ